MSGSFDDLVRAYGEILRALPCPKHDGLAETPERAAKALIEMTSGYLVDVPGLFTMFDGEGYDELVVERGIAFSSLCEHHLLPFTGVAHIAYLPGTKIVGLSKLARLVEAFSQRLQVQERMTSQIADALMEHLGAAGAAVITEARHSCMELRGVRKHGVVAVASALRGTIKAQPETRAEVLALLRP